MTVWVFAPAARAEPPNLSLMGGKAPPASLRFRNGLRKAPPASLETPQRLRPGAFFSGRMTGPGPGRGAASAVPCGPAVLDATPSGAGRRVTGSARHRRPPGRLSCAAECIRGTRKRRRDLPHGRTSPRRSTSPGRPAERPPGPRRDGPYSDFKAAPGTAGPAPVPPALGNAQRLAYAVRRPCRPFDVVVAPGLEALVTSGPVDVRIVPAAAGAVLACIGWACVSLAFCFFCS